MLLEEKRVNSQGRVILPSEWRKQHLGADGVVVIIQRGEELLIRARSCRRPSELFDTLKADFKE